MTCLIGRKNKNRKRGRAKAFINNNNKFLHDQNMHPQKNNVVEPTFRESGCSVFEIFGHIVLKNRHCSMLDLQKSCR